MWTWIFDDTAGAFCRTLKHATGSLPYPCLVSAGRPALVMAGAILVILFIVAILAWRRFRPG